MTTHIYRGRQAFTIVELLVVIGIIAVIIAILLPALKAAREQARTIACRSNLTQMNLAVRMYANDNNDHYPPIGTAYWPGLKSDADYGKGVGNGSYRRGAGVTGEMDTYTAYVTNAREVWGIPGLFAYHKYIPAGSAVWICPGAPEVLVQMRNTYQWSNPATISNRKYNQPADSTTRTRSMSPLKDMFFLACWQQKSYPAKAGDRSSDTFLVFNLSSASMQPFNIPKLHKLKKKPATNYLYMDGRIEMK